MTIFSAKSKFNYAYVGTADVVHRGDGTLVFVKHHEHNIIPWVLQFNNNVGGSCVRRQCALRCACATTAAYYDITRAARARSQSRPPFVRAQAAARARGATDLYPSASRDLASMPLHRPPARYSLGR